jgi:hypothetical protein
VLPSITSVEPADSLISTPEVVLSSPLQLQMRGMKKREKSKKQQFIEYLLMFHLLAKIDQTN